MEEHPGDVAASWEVKVAGGTHKIIFEHGTTSGKRIINVDGIEVGIAPEGACYHSNSDVSTTRCIGRTGCSGWSELSSLRLDPSLQR